MISLYKCVASSISVHLFRRSCALETYGCTKGQADSYLLPHPKKKIEKKEEKKVIFNIFVQVYGHFLTILNV